MSETSDLSDRVLGETPGPLRLPDLAAIRVASSHMAYLLADGRGYVLRPLADVYVGTADFDAPLEVRRLRDQFEHIWALSDIHQKLRRLYL